MEQRKLRPKVQIKKFLEDNKKVIKGLGRKTCGTEIYTREPWMTEANPMDDRYEEFLYKESGSL
jgi:hypothetical protein